MNKEFSEALYIRSFPDITYGVFSCSKFKLYIFGDQESIKCAKFNIRGDASKIAGHCNSKSSPAVDAALKFLDLYFQKKPSALPALDLGIFTVKESRVYKELIKVPFGKIISYEMLSERSGIPHGARFVGNAMAKNIFPVLIPCHRVIKSNGDIGNYSSGTDIKKFLLHHEGFIS